MFPGKAGGFCPNPAQIPNSGPASLGHRIPRGSIVVPFCGSYLESYKVIPKRNYYGAYG